MFQEGRKTHTTVSVTINTDAGTLSGLIKLARV